MLYQRPTDLVFGNIFLALPDFIENATVILKFEGLSITGSIKIKAALRMIDGLESSGQLKPGGRVIESSSGNLGLALSMVCAERGYKFTCVTDPNFAVASETMMTAYGARVIVVDVRDQNGGYLQARLSLIRKMMAEDHGLVWVNQYANMDNVMAHYSTTGQEILAEFPRPTIVFIGAGATGTLGGVSTVMRERSPETRIVAIDSAGSITFGGAPGRRYIPGLGTSVAPSLRTSARFDELIMIPEIEAIDVCRGLAQRGLLVGGSTGTVLSASDTK